MESVKPSGRYWVTLSPETPRIFLLGLISGEVLQKEDVYLFQIVSIACKKKAIIRFWLKRPQPQLDRWQGIVEEIL